MTRFWYTKRVTLGNQRRFSLVELMLATAIIGILSAIVRAALRQEAHHHLGSAAEGHGAAAAATGRTAVERFDRPSREADSAATTARRSATPSCADAPCDKPMKSQNT